LQTPVNGMPVRIAGEAESTTVPPDAASSDSKD